MPRARASMAKLLVSVGLISVGLAALRVSSRLWANATFSFALTALVASIALLIHRRGPGRSFWVGFALFGWTYFAAAFGPSSTWRDLLVTAPLLAAVAPVRRALPLDVLDGHRPLQPVLVGLVPADRPFPLLPRDRHGGRGVLPPPPRPPGRAGPHAMKLLINRPEAVVPEMLEGLVVLHPGLRKLPGLSVIVRADADAWRDRRVALISGGGSGHEPAHAGYVGRGMLSAAVAGDVFTSPDPDSVLGAIRAVAGRAGALLIVKNYTGDRLNFGLAAEMARAEGIAVEVVVVGDDVALPATEQTAGPRGLAGTVLVHKVAGAAAEAGAKLAEVAAEARSAAGAVATMGVALSACTVPAAGRPGFVLSEREVELGLGIHGEPGVRRAPFEPADALVDRLLGPILGPPEARPGRVALLVNGLGGTTAMELAIVARAALAGLEGRGIVVERAYAGTFLSALEMAGVSLSVLGLDDGRLARLDAPTEAPAWPNFPPRVRVQREATGPIPVGPPAAPPSPPTTDDGRALGAAIARAADALIREAPRLTELDQAVGDGDLGVSLARGASAVLGALATWPLDDPATTLHALGTALQRTLGGTSGPLYAMFFLRASVRLRESPAALAEAFRDGCLGIAELGGAKPGDRTMLDALVPASDAFSAALDADKTPRDALRDAVAAAEAGAEATASLKPRRGRSSYIGDRALGHPDPGAVAAAVWLRAVSGRPETG